MLQLEDRSAAGGSPRAPRWCGSGRRRRRGRSTRRRRGAVRRRGRPRGRRPSRRPRRRATPRDRGTLDRVSGERPRGWQQRDAFVRPSARRVGGARALAAGRPRRRLRRWRCAALAGEAPRSSSTDALGDRGAARRRWSAASRAPPQLQVRARASGLAGESVRRSVLRAGRPARRRRGGRREPHRGRSRCTDVMRTPRDSPDPRAAAKSVPVGRALLSRASCTAAVRRPTQDLRALRGDAIQAERGSAARSRRARRAGSARQGDSPPQRGDPRLTSRRDRRRRRRRAPDRSSDAASGKRASIVARQLPHRRSRRMPRTRPAASISVRAPHDGQRVPLVALVRRAIAEPRQPSRRGARELPARSAGVVRAASELFAARPAKVCQPIPEALGQAARAACRLFHHASAGESSTCCRHRRRH